MAKQWPGRWFNAKEKNLKKLLDRGEHKEALELLVELYYQPDTSLLMRQRCVQELLSLEVLTDQYLAVYIDYLRQASEDEVAHEIRTLLTNLFCTVDFDTRGDRLASANEVALRLRKEHLQAIPGCACTQGLHTLLLASSPQLATPLFEEALQVDAANHVAQTGLLLSLLAQYDYDQAWNCAQQFKQPQHPQVEELTRFLQTNRWLDDPTLPGPLPLSTQQLELLHLTRYTCLSTHTITLVSARMYLLEGNAAQALALLRPAVAQLDNQPRWYYAIAWACALLGDQEGVASAWQAASGWSGRWTIACLLLDANPTLAHKYGIPDEYRDTPALPPAYATLFLLRTTQALAIPPEQSPWQPTTGTIEENMEALRCQLGAAFRLSNAPQMHHYINMYLFERLPLADQLFWRGLHLSLTDDPRQAHALLDRAANSYGHYRAAFVLALLLLSQQHMAQTSPLLDIICAGQHDPQTRLLQAYHQCYQGDLTSAEASLTELVNLDNVRANYALGNLWLLRAQDAERQGQSAKQCYAEAASHFEKAQNQEQKLPHASTEYAYRAGYAHLSFLIATHAPGTSAHLVSTHEQHATTVGDIMRERGWQEILPHLFNATSAQVAVACEDLLALLITGPRPGGRICLALSWHIARACSQAENVEQAEKMLALLKYLADDASFLDVRSVYQRSLALFARLHYQKADPALRPDIYQWIKTTAHKQHDNFAQGLLAASLSLHYEDRSSAMTILAEYAPVDSLPTPITDPDGRLRREWNLLCAYQASSAYKSANYLKAARYLRLAVMLESQPTEIARFKDFALLLEGEAAVQRLLALLELEAPAVTYRLGRYRFLVHILEKHPTLREILLQENSDANAIESQWAKLLQNGGHEITFLHGLAVLYRERALACLDRQQPDEKALLLNILLWSLLLCTREFWAHFTQTHSTRQDASGQTISLQRSNELMQQVVVELLSRHSLAARRYLREGRIQSALIHLHCLELCCSGPNAMIEKLRTLGVTFNIPVDEARMQFLREQALQHSDQCFEELLQEAYTATTSSELVKTLPDGIRKYYEGGIRQLEPCLELLHELNDTKRLREVLLTCLEWYIHWCDDLWQQHMCEALIDTALSSFTLGKKLRAFCTKGKERVLPEQRAISSYLVYQALTEQIASAAPMLKEALEWNPYHNFARQCLDEVRYWQTIIENVQPYIQEYSSKELRRLTNRDPVLLRNADEYPLVYLFLNRVPPLAYRKPQAWSKSKVAPGKGALGFKPIDPGEMRQPAMPEPKRPATTSSTSPQDAQMTKLLEGGQKALATQRYDDAIEYLQRALQYTSDEEQRREVKRQLSSIYTVKGERLMPEIQLRKSTGSPYFALQRSALDSFQHALSYDAGNQMAREYQAQLKL